MKIADIISSRLQQMGTSQAQVAKEIGTSPTQLGLFLKGNGTLTNPVLEKLLNVVGINLEACENRNKLADKVAAILRERGIGQEELGKWSKSQLALYTDINDLKLLMDVDDIDTYKRILESGLVDVECTFPYFKALVAYKLNLKYSKITASTANRALLGSLVSVKLGLGLAATTIVSPAVILGAAAIGAAFGATTSNPKAHTGAVHLFDKAHPQSLNTKAMEYVATQREDSK